MTSTITMPGAAADAGDPAGKRQAAETAARAAAAKIREAPRMSTTSPLLRPFLTASTSSARV